MFGPLSKNSVQQNSALRGDNEALIVRYNFVHKSSIFIPVFLLVGMLSTSLPFSSLPSYWSGSCPQVSHFHPCLLIGRALVHKSPIFIPAFLLVGLLSTSLPFPFLSFNHLAVHTNLYYSVSYSVSPYVRSGLR